MKFPIPGFKAEEAAQDFAADVRDLGRQCLPLWAAIQCGEATEQDRVTYDMLRAQVQSMSDIVFVCMVTDREYRVGDYVTEGLRIKSKLRNAAIAAGYSRLRKALLH